MNHVLFGVGIGLTYFSKTFAVAAVVVADRWFKGCIKEAAAAIALQTNVPKLVNRRRDRDLEYLLPTYYYYIFFVFLLSSGPLHIFIYVLI